MARKQKQPAAERVAIELWFITQAIITLGLGMVVRLSEIATAKRSHVLRVDEDGWAKVLTACQLKAGEWLQLASPPPKYMAAELVAVDQSGAILPAAAVDLLMHADRPIYRIVGTDDGKVIGVTDDGLICLIDGHPSELDPTEFSESDRESLGLPPVGSGEPPPGSGTGAAAPAS